MIIPKEKRLTPEQFEEVLSITREYGVDVQEIIGTQRCIYAMKGDETKELLINRIEGLSYIDHIETMQSAYKLMDRQSQLANHTTQIGGKKVGQDMIVIAGHCTIDPKNTALFLETSQAIAEAGVTGIRGGVWKPRTSPYSFQGDDKALEVLLRAKKELGLPICTEVMEQEHVDICLAAGVDCLQVGTRNGLNYSLLRALGEKIQNTKTIVLLKRSRHMAPVDEFILAGEYIVAAGNPNVVLVPRGTLPTMDGYRNYPDESIVPLLKQRTWAPIIVDPSHSVGRATYVPKASLAAMAYGADGILVETHIDPSKGIGDDPKQAITPKVLTKLIKDMQCIFDMKQNYET